MRLLAIVRGGTISPFARHDGPRHAVSTGDDAWFDDNIPCMRACPVQTDVASYVADIAGGDPDVAARTNLDQNIFSASLARTCGRPCEDACRRAVVDAPIRIRALKRVATDSLASGRSPSGTGGQPPRAPETGRRVAIVGAGVAGLAAARDLRRQGHSVTIFERDREPGGLLAVAIPPWRLPRHDAIADVRRVLDLGLDLRTGVAVGTEITLEEITAKADAVIIATGAQRHSPLPAATDSNSDINASTTDGTAVLDGTTFLRHCATGRQPAPRGPAIVVGGGYTAFDCARTLRRLGDLGVTVVMRGEPRAAIAADMADAAAEGVTVLTGYQVRAVSVASSRIVAVGPDGADQEFPCGTLVMATGARPDLEALGIPPRPASTESPVDLVSGQLDGWPAVWLAGDVATGPSSLIDAIASGRLAAARAHAHLASMAQAPPTSPVRPPVSGTARPAPARLDDRLRERVDGDQGYRAIEPQAPRALPLSARGLATGNLTLEVDAGLTSEAGLLEANRCLQCQANIMVDAERCILCNGCVDVCPHGCLEIVGLDRLTSIDGHSPSVDDLAAPATAALLLREDDCIRCGKCVDWCPTACMSLETHRPAAAGMPRTIDIRQLARPDTGPKD